jgi:hypothetical protein
MPEPPPVTKIVLPVLFMTYRLLVECKSMFNYRMSPERRDDGGKPLPGRFINRYVKMAALCS